jgi:uncharacterized membrane protein YhaH (DUF805 family)
MKAFLGSGYYCENVINLIIIKTPINAVHTLMFANFAQSSRIIKKKKLKYIVRIVIVVVSTMIVLITTTMFARRLKNAKIVTRLY